MNGAVFVVFTTVAVAFGSVAVALEPVAVFVAVVLVDTEMMYFIADFEYVAVTLTVGVDVAVVVATIS